MEKIDVEKFLPAILNLPIVRVDRPTFLKKELKPYYPEDVIETAIAYSPAYAGIPKDFIDKAAKDVINYETTKVTALSFAAGLPGGFAMAGTIPADLTQYFTFILRVLQKLAYLYSFPEFDLNEDNLTEDTLNQLLVFLGVMWGVQGANAGLKMVAETLARKLANDLPKKALTKTALYPIVKKIAGVIGVNMTKQTFAKGASKVVPVISGVISGGLSYSTFKPSAKRLQKSLSLLPICDPNSEIYKNVKTDTDFANIYDEIFNSNEEQEETYAEET